MRLAVYETEEVDTAVCIEWAAVSHHGPGVRGRLVSDPGTVAALVGRMEAEFDRALHIEAAAAIIPGLAEALNTWPQCIEPGPLRLHHRVAAAAEFVADYFF